MSSSGAIDDSSPDTAVSGGHDCALPARPRRDAARLVRHVGERQILDLGGDPEVAVARRLAPWNGKSQRSPRTRNVALVDRAVAHRAGRRSCARLGQAERQVARRARGDGRRRACRRARAGPDSARRAPKPLPAPVRQVALSSPFGIGVGEASPTRTLTVTLRRRAARDAARSSSQLGVEPVERQRSRSSNTPGRSTTPCSRSMRASPPASVASSCTVGVAQAGPADRVVPLAGVGGERQAAQLALDPIARAARRAARPSGCAAG